MASQTVAKKPDDVTTGHHGTYLETAKKILNEGFKATTNEDHYWGDGIYFYESGEKDAIQWAKDKQAREKGGKIAVIMSQISTGDCLDLDRQDHRDLVLDMREKLLAEGLAEETVTTPFAINALAVVLGTDTVRLTYESKAEGKLFSGSRLFRRVASILCVRKLQRILSSVLSYQEA
jgi:hypothetical protein